MANVKSAKKRIVSSSKKGKNNNITTATMKSSIRKVDKLVAEGKKKEAGEALKITIKNIDKAYSKGLVHKNTASRYKSRLTKAVNALK